MASKYRVSNVITAKSYGAIKIFWDADPVSDIAETKRFEWLQ